MKQLKRENISTRPIRVMQFGGGNFLRAYIDWMIDILNTETNFDGDVLLIKPTEHGDYSKLKNQDGLYLIHTKGFKDGELLNELQLIQCIQQIVHPYVEWGNYLETATIPSIRFIVSNTTESGITFNPADSKDDTPAQEFPAKLCQWLWARYTHFNGDIQKGCLFLPCELIKENGQTLKECILKYAIHWDLELSFHEWIHEACHFSNTLVDRIVTGYPEVISDDVIAKIDGEDKLLVESEPYHLFVIEGSSIFKDELPFNKTNLNVVFTDNLKLFREIKVRILNGAHTAMVPVAYLAGLRTVKDAIEDPSIGQYIQQLLQENILPTLDYPQEQLTTYIQDTIERFKNPYIKHQLIDISLNSISKFKTRLLPSLLAFNHQTGRLPRHIVRALAALIVFYRGHYNGEAIPLRDSKEVLDFFNQNANLDQNVNAHLNQKEKENENQNMVTIEWVDIILGNETLWGMDLSQIEHLNKQLVVEILNVLDQQHVS